MGEAHENTGNQGEYQISDTLREQIAKLNDDIEFGKDVDYFLEFQRQNQDLTVAQLMAFYKRLSTEDSLTNVKNKRGFREQTSKVHSHALRHREPYAVIVVDVDKFKEVNDTYGHSVGDMVLRAIADGIKKCTRPEDTVGRVGGDEFACILPSYTGEDAEIKNSRARIMKTVREELKNVFKDHPLNSVDISLGVAQWRGEETFEEVFIKADQKVYKAKGVKNNGQ